MAAGCIDSEDQEYRDAPAPASPEEARWARRKSLQASCWLLLPFLMVLGLILVFFSVPTMLDKQSAWPEWLRFDLDPASVPAILVQAMLLLLFPGLYVMEASHARDLIARRHPEGKTSKEALEKQQ